jgi:YidC/Oxa1 family membrane protein insertase
MNFLINIFNTVLYQPLFNALILLYLYIPGRDFGLAIILLTIIIKLFLYPLAAKGIKSQKALASLQPKIKEIQEKFKDDKERQSRELMDLYKKENTNPFSGCLPLLIQLPILITLFRLFREGFTVEKMSFLYSFVPSFEAINTTFFGIVNLAEPSIILAILTGIAQFFQAKMISPKKKKQAAGQTPDFSQMMQKQTLYFLPAFTIFILWSLPSALALYWLTTTVFTIVQQYIILKNNDTGKLQQN